MIFLQWIRLGANLSNFQFSLGSIVFHLGLGGELKLRSWYDEKKQRKLVSVVPDFNLRNKDSTSKATTGLRRRVKSATF